MYLLMCLKMQLLNVPRNVHFERPIFNILHSCGVDDMLNTPSLTHKQTQQTHPQWNLARNVIPSNTTVPSGTESFEIAADPPRKMKIPKRLTSLRKVKELRDLLMSPRLYLNNEVYTTFATAFESGHMRGTTPAAPQPLEDTLSVAAEAHFRAELWFSLGEYDFKHKVAKAWLQHRKATWQKCCKFVFDDRTANAKPAWIARQAAPQTASANEDDDRKGVVSVKAPVDQKYW